MKVCPAIDIVPVLELSPLLVETVKLTVPLPVPFPPLGEVMVIQEGLLTAVQEQLAVVVTVKLLVPPEKLMLALRGEREYTQGWVTGEVLKVPSDPEEVPTLLAATNR